MSRADYYREYRARKKSGTPIEGQSEPVLPSVSDLEARIVELQTENVALIGEVKLLKQRLASYATPAKAAPIDDLFGDHGTLPPPTGLRARDKLISETLTRAFPQKGRDK